MSLVGELSQQLVSLPNVNAIMPYQPGLALPGVYDDLYFGLFQEGPYDVSAVVSFQRSGIGTQLY